MPGDGVHALAPTVRERLAVLQGGVSAALVEAGRDTSDVTLVVITKFHPVSLIQELFALGIRDFGESRHQEAQVKSRDLFELAPRWHFIGQLQSKKARQVARYADVIHSLDRENLIDALGGSTPEIDRSDSAQPLVPTEVFLQINLTADPDRGGVAPAQVERLAERVLQTPELRLLGVMAIAPRDEEPRSAFERLRAVSESVRGVVAGARFISAGMSGDYREALLEGATHLRIGSAITGIRPVAE